MCDVATTELAEAPDGADRPRIPFAQLASSWTRAESEAELQSERRRRRKAEQALRELEVASAAVIRDLRESLATAAVGPALDPQGHFVYIHRDEEGACLYVGMSSNVMLRQGKHSRESSWWPQVRQVEFIRCESRSLALSLERRMIEKLRPAMNVDHNWRVVSA